jgi:hypothetical protein
MTDAKILASPSATSRLEQLFPKLTPRQLARLSTRGRTRTIGDVRSGSLKRVASAVGEGSIAISFVHQALSE